MPIGKKQSWQMHTDCLQKVPPRIVVNIQDGVTAVTFVEKINKKNYNFNSSFLYKVSVYGLFLYLKSSRIYFDSKIMGTFFTNLLYFIKILSKKNN